MQLIKALYKPKQLNTATPTHHQNIPFRKKFYYPTQTPEETNIPSTKLLTNS